MKINQLKKERMMNSLFPIYPSQKMNTQHTIRPVETASKAHTNAVHLSNGWPIYHVFNSTNLVVVSGLSFAYPGQRHPLLHLNMTFKRGELTGLIGANGSGKSTLLKVLNKEYTPTDGTVLVDGIHWSHFDIDAWREQVAFVHGNHEIYSDTILYNIALSHHPDDSKEAISFCLRTGFSNYFQEFPRSYLTNIGAKGFQISSGQRQLILMARELFKQPQILLLDEPTLGLDRKTENFVLNLLNKEKQNRIVLISTTQPALAQKCDHVVLLDKGIVASSGSPRDRLIAEKLELDAILGAHTFR
ncbi:MAG: ATP-binding cassette domain-containing protein [Cyclobacteriaceae bacterium]|jgi:ABC-type bacteriocin/lantibiotic exporter with double-glycine peptidase domain|nr:ABC transporter ATP-binding protein [Flammeovirgaceae bacterium]